MVYTIHKEIKLVIKSFISKPGLYKIAAIFD
jgi:hypothetical protein